MQTLNQLKIGDIIYDLAAKFDAEDNNIKDTYSTKEYVTQKISELVNSAPETLDTLKELADEKYYDSLDFFELENVKKKVAPLMKYLSGDDVFITITNFNDSIETNERETKYNFDDFKITDGEPFTNYIVDYFYNYNKNSYTVQIGNRLLNGFVRIEAKTKFKDDYDGKLRTVLLVFPKVRIYSNINLNFGENAPFNLAQMSATAYKGERDFMEIIFLDEDISSDIKE